jgi:hypothetical protein
MFDISARCFLGIQSVRVILSVASKGVRVKQAYMVLNDVATMQLFRKLQDRKQSMWMVAYLCTDSDKNGYNQLMAYGCMTPLYRYDVRASKR